MDTWRPGRRASSFEASDEKEYMGVTVAATRAFESFM
jgi:hypothetical protein